MAESLEHGAIANITDEDQAISFLIQEGVPDDKAKRVLAAARKGNV